MSIDYVSVLREELAQAITNKEPEQVFAALDKINLLWPKEQLEIFASPAKSHDTILHIAADGGDIYILNYILQTILYNLKPTDRLELFEATNKIGENAVQIAESENHPYAAQLIDQCFIETEKAIIASIVAESNSQQDIVADQQETRKRSWVEKVSKQPSTPDIQCIMQ